MVTVRLRQSVTGSAGHLTAIADGQMDLALVSITAPGSPLVTLRELMREPMVFVCEASHPLANRRRVELADLAGHDFIQLPPGWGIRQRLDKGFAAAGVQPVSAYEVADYAITAELIPHRLASAILPASAANRFPDLRNSSPASIHHMDAVNRLRGVPTRQPRDQCAYRHSGPPCRLTRPAA